MSGHIPAAPNTVGFRASPFLLACAKTLGFYFPLQPPPASRRPAAASGTSRFVSVSADEVRGGNADVRALR